MAKIVDLLLMLQSVFEAGVNMPIAVSTLALDQVVVGDSLARWLKKVRDVDVAVRYADSLNEGVPWRVSDVVGAVKKVFER